MQENLSVQVVRHVRPLMFNQQVGGPVKSNLGGASVVFRVDYRNKLVKASWSVCSPDVNFCKKEGERRALERSDYCLTFPLGQVDLFNGLVNALIWNISKSMNPDLEEGDFLEWVNNWAHPRVVYSILRDQLRQNNAR